MQTLTSGIRRTMAVLLAALSMMIGWVVIYLTYQYLRESGQMDHLSGDILLLFAYAFPIILCGLMLGIIAGIDRRAFLRIGLWTAVGGMFGYLADIPVRMINTWRILNHVSTSSVWYIWVVYLCMITVMATYGLFCGGGLGFAFGGWKACKRFALFGMLANAIGIVVASLISTGAYNLLFHGSSVWTQITGSRIYSSILPYLNSAFTGILSGSVLGWFFGNEGKRGFADPRENLVANT